MNRNGPSEGLTPELLDDLKLAEFVALDIETTGLDYQKEDIIEFAAVRFRYGDPVEQLQFYVRPGKPIPDFITRITGIRNADVQDAPPFPQVLDRIRHFTGELPLVAHHVQFDLPFLEYHARRATGDFRDWDQRIRRYHFFPNPKYDTALLAKMYLHFLPSFRLGALANYFRIPLEAAHRALPDAEVAGKLFLRLLEISLRTPFADVQKILQILEPTDDPIKTFFENLALCLATGKYHFTRGLNREEFTIQTHFYNVIGEGDTPETGTLEIHPIDEEAIACFFEAGGALSQEFAAFEVRRQQVDMSRAIARAFNEGKFLVVEAGTGTGKSLAYLVPAIQWAVRNYGPNGRVIISTNTKNLQEQLFFKDLPILHSVLRQPFKAVLLKGKGNYLCLEKWATVLHDIQYRLSEQERIKILPLYFWVQQTQTGDIAENNGFQVERNPGVWSKFIAENNYCPGRTCPYYDRCFLWRARNNARDAHLVLVNHSLLFSDLAADQAILGDYVNVIFDEAHNIEKTATDYLGTEITLWEFRDFFRKLYGKDKMETGILVQLKRRVQQGNIETAHRKAVLSMVDQLIEQIPETWKITQAFFRQLTGELREKVNSAAPGAVGNDQRQAQKHRYTREDGLMERMKSYFQDCKRRIGRIQGILNDLIEYFKNLPENSFDYQQQIYQELNAQFSQAEALINNLEFLLTAEWDHFVYWFELPYRIDSDDVRLYAAPLDVAGILAQRLYGKLHTGIFTSATLAVNKEFHYFHKRVGLDRMDPERVENLLLDSPFHYEEQVLLLVPAYIPEPKEPEYLPQVKRFLQQLAKHLPRGTLVLFTSYAMLNDVYYAVRENFEAENLPLLGQGIDGSRHTIMSQFKMIERSVLFGTDSFWEGVDVPGKALEVLLITRLPFDVPSEPIIQAKAELIRKQGGNPFMDFSIPEAVIRLRQGFGRLIRSQSDYGAIILLDTRVIKKLYGRIFLQSLPLHAKIVGEEAECWRVLRNWFGE